MPYCSKSIVVDNLLSAVNIASLVLIIKEPATSNAAINASPAESSIAPARHITQVFLPSNSSLCSSASKLLILTVPLFISLSATKAVLVLTIKQGIFLFLHDFVSKETVSSLLDFSPDLLRLTVGFAFVIITTLKGSLFSFSSEINSLKLRDISKMEVFGGISKDLSVIAPRGIVNIIKTYN